MRKNQVSKEKWNIILKWENIVFYQKEQKTKELKKEQVKNQLNFDE